MSFLQNMRLNQNRADNFPNFIILIFTPGKSLIKSSYSRLSDSDFSTEIIAKPFGLPEARVALKLFI